MQRGVNVLSLQCKIKTHGKLFNSLLEYSFSYVKVIPENFKMRRFRKTPFKFCLEQYFIVAVFTICSECVPYVLRLVIAERRNTILQSAP